MNAICILADEETFTELEGSSVCFVSDDNLELLNSGAPLSQHRHLERYDLSNPAHLRALADRLEWNRRGAV